MKSRSYLKYVSSFLKELPFNSGDNIRQGSARPFLKSPISLGKEGRLAHECPVRRLEELSVKLRIRNHWTKKGGDEDRPARGFSASISQ